MGHLGTSKHDLSDLARKLINGRPKDEAGNAAPDNRPHTHAAWFARGVERGALQFLRAMSPEELADRHHLPMGRWVVFQLAEITAFGEHLSIVHDNATEEIVAKLYHGNRLAH